MDKVFVIKKACTVCCAVIEGEGKATVLIFNLRESSDLVKCGSEQAYKQFP